MQKKEQKLVRQMNKTVQFGYALFLADIINVFLATILPFSLIFSQPDSKHDNLIIVIIFLVADAIVPIVISYLIGMYSSHRSPLYLKRYNGVLLALLAYWIGLLLSAFDIPIAPPLHTPFVIDRAMNSWTAAFTVLAILIVGASYMRHAKRISILQYTPFQVLLGTTMGGLLLYESYNFILSFVSGVGPSSIKLWELATILFPVIVALVSYNAAQMNKTTTSQHITDALVATSIVMVAMSLANQLLALTDIHFMIQSMLSYLICLVVWAAYLPWGTLRQCRL